MIRHRIQTNMQYDDFTNILLVNVIYDYMFLFNALMLQDISLARQFIVVINFIILQVQNVNNANLFYQIYRYFAHRHIKFIRNIVIIKYIIMITVSSYLFIVQMIEQIGLVVIAGIIYKAAAKMLIFDNQRAKD